MGRPAKAPFDLERRGRLADGCSLSYSQSARQAEHFGKRTGTPAYREAGTRSGIGARNLSRLTEAAGSGALYAPPIQTGEPVTRKQAWRETAAPASPARHSSRAGEIMSTRSRADTTAAVLGGLSSSSPSPVTRTACGKVASNAHK